MSLFSPGQADNASSDIRCSMTTIRAVSPDTQWETIDKKAYVNEEANEVTEIPPKGHQRDLKRSMMKGGIVMTEVRRLKADTEREAVTSARTAKDPRPTATKESGEKSTASKGCSTRNSDFPRKDGRLLGDGNPAGELSEVLCIRGRPSRDGTR